MVSGGLTPPEAAGLILGVTSLAVSSPIVVGVGLGAAGGLLIAYALK
jgi:hypothetical protein